MHTLMLALFFYNFVKHVDSNVYVKITYNFIFLILTLIVNSILCFCSYSDFVFSLDFVTVFLSSCCTAVDFVT